MESFNDIWKEVLARCRAEVSDVMYNMWLTPLEFKKFENYTVIFSIAAEFKRAIILDKFGKMIKDRFEEILGFPVDIDIIVDIPMTEEQQSNESASKKENSDKESNPEEETAETGKSEKTPIDFFTFDSFIVGKSNSFAYNTSLSVAEEPGKKYNPLLIYGRSGLGKTHLMFAIYNKIKRDNPDAIIIYTTGESFMTELIECITKKNMIYFHNKYRNADALLVDDIQYIQSGTSVQEEFFHTFNVLQQANKQIVMTSDVPPREMQGFDERIRTRFEMGVLADIQPPDIDTRKAIVKRKCRSLNIELSESIIDYITQKIKLNVRQLEGIVKKLEAMTKFNGKQPTMEEIQNIVRDITTDSEPVGVTIDKVLDIVSTTFGVSVSDLKSEKRQANITQSRQVAMYILKEITELTLKDIGECFNKNHSTVLHSIDSCRDKMNENPRFKSTVMNIIRDLRENK